MSERRFLPTNTPHPVARVQAAIEGREPAGIMVLENSVLLLGDHQFYPGYCVLWARQSVKELHHLEPLAYMGFMIELRQVSEAIERAYLPWKLNVVSLGNQVQHVHVHLFPRSADDLQRLEHPWIHSAEFKAVGLDEQQQAVERIKIALGVQNS